MYKGSSRECYSCVLDSPQLYFNRTYPFSSNMSQNPSDTILTSGEGHPLRPPFDKAFSQAEIDMDWETMRIYTESMNIGPSAILDTHPDLTHEDIKIPAIEGLDEHEPTLAVFQSKTSGNKSRPVILYAHGGGQIVGNRFLGVEQMLDMVKNVGDVVFASVEYRLAPEHRAPAGAHDCYAAAVYLADHATELGIDASRILIYGVSGGAGPAAA